MTWLINNFEYTLYIYSQFQTDFEHADNEGEPNVLWKLHEVGSKLAWRDSCVWWFHYGASKKLESRFKRSSICGFN